jgi:hypothetical protein
MSAENDKALVRRFFEEVWNQNGVEVAKQIVQDNYSSIENVDFPSVPGPQIVAGEMKLYRSLYEGLSFKIERMFADANTVVTVWQASGTSKDETFVNRKGETVPKSLQAEGVSLTEVKDGKIAAHRFLWPRKPLFP